MSVTVHLLFDFGEVISVAQPAGEVAALAALTGLPTPEFTDRYWAHRPAYDAGGPARTYWTSILGSPPAADLLHRLVALDVASWLHLNPGTVELLETLHATGTPVSLLSNAPHELARELDHHPSLQPFRRRLFSADLTLIKPDPHCYRAALAALDTAAEDVVFVDDRPANIEAATALGMAGIIFDGSRECLDAVTRAARTT